MKITTFASALVLVIAGFVSAAAVAQQTPVPVVTGQNWVNATEGEKLAFLLGMATVIEIEQELQEANPPRELSSLVPTLVEGLDGMRLRDIMLELDNWYVANGDQLTRPVVETLWFELALPNAPQ
ncbi:MAG: hypothetical protein ACFCBW_20820 [Candidatus Competibacterales bacterium]